MIQAIGALAVGVVAILLGGSALCHAQVGRIWSPQELVAESDVVAICEHLNTVTLGTRTVHPELRPDLPVVEVSSRLKLLVSLKGEADSEIQISHYWLDPARVPEGVGVVNAGSELRFGDTGPYLVFLRKQADGRYRPTTGYTFPDGSVKRLLDMRSFPTRR